MHHLIALLRRPTKDTIVLLGAAFAAVCAFIILSLPLSSTQPAQPPYPGYSPDYLLVLARVFVRDMIFISRLILELTVVVLVAQIIYRLIQKWRNFYRQNSALNQE